MKSHFRNTQIRFLNFFQNKFRSWAKLQQEWNYFFEKSWKNRIKLFLLYLSLLHFDWENTKGILLGKTPKQFLCDFNYKFYFKFEKYFNVIIVEKEHDSVKTRSGTWLEIWEQKKRMDSGIPDHRANGFDEMT